MRISTGQPRLWFDVEKKNYTTKPYETEHPNQLWFDVEKKNYTTFAIEDNEAFMLWFDVEKKNYTTSKDSKGNWKCCGLM